MTGNIVDLIPQALMHTLTELRPILETQGVIQLHRSGYRLRYRQHDADSGYTVHRSVKLGDDNVAMAVTALLDEWRGARSAARHAKKIEQQRAGTERKMLRSIYARDGSGWRRRRQLRKWVESFKDKPGELFYYQLTEKLPDRRPRGRPSRW
jgi:hypothetical protein